MKTKTLVHQVCCDVMDLADQLLIDLDSLRELKAYIHCDKLNVTVKLPTSMPKSWQRRRTPGTRGKAGTRRCQSRSERAARSKITMKEKIEKSRNRNVQDNLHRQPRRSYLVPRTVPGTGSPPFRQPSAVSQSSTQCYRLLVPSRLLQYTVKEVQWCDECCPPGVVSAGLYIYTSTGPWGACCSQSRRPCLFVY